MMVQEYYIKMSQDNLDNADYAQFVFASDDSNMASGFISEIDLINEMMRFSLFEPIEYEDYMLNCIPILTMEDIMLRLTYSLEKNPDMKQAWHEVIDNSKTC